MIFELPDKNAKNFATISHMRFCANQGMFLIGLTFHFVSKFHSDLLSLMGEVSIFILRPTMGGFP